MPEGNSLPSLGGGEMELRREAPYDIVLRNGCRHSDI